MDDTHHVGERLSFDGALCTVRYIGPVAGTTGSWLGVEWDDAVRGKHDGRHKDVRYFECLSRSPVAASFVRPSRRADRPQSFIAALHEKYATEGMARLNEEDDAQRRNPELEIVYFGRKMAEEVGFDKIRRQLARVDELNIVILDGMRIAWDVQFDDGGRTIGETSPLVTELDLSRNLFESFGTVARICRELPDLRSLRLNGNRFQLLHEEGAETARDPFEKVTELEVEENLLPWEGVIELASHFRALSKLSASLNQLSAIPETSLGSLASTLTAVTLEYNDFTSLSDLAPLSALTSLKSLHLKGNSITSITPSIDVPQPTFSPSLVFLDVSYNAITSWSVIDALPNSIPSLSALRISHNPLYDAPDAPDGQSRNASQSAAAAAAYAKTSEETYMVAVARLPGLRSLNFTAITPQERTNAELFYLSRIARQLSSVPEDEEASVLNQHPLYAALCEAHGEPDIVRRQEINPNFLEARLVNVHFTYTPEEGETRQATTQIPRSFDVYAVKGIAGRLFGARPLGLRLVWETGEWDPVGGFDEELGGSSDDEEEEEDDEERDKRAALEADLRHEQAVAAGHGERVDLARGGQWVRREVELADGPRQLGFCVDGLEAAIRVEVRA